MNHTRKAPTEFPKTYKELVRQYCPRPLHTDAECEVASAIVEKMIGHPLNADQEDYMDLLATLVMQYDDAHHPVKTEPMTQVEVLEYLLEESGRSASDLGRLLGNRELGSKLLRGERSLSLAHIAKLSEYFHLSPELFMPKISAKKTRKKTQPNGRWRVHAESNSTRAKR
jgi:HTH-type transcriptional regulator/antitoxin HigA